jgi:hypothetical protein
VTHHGILASASGLRAQVVPRRVEEEGGVGCRHAAGDGAAGEGSGGDAAGDLCENVATAALQRQQAERQVRAGCGCRMVVARAAVGVGGIRGLSCWSGGSGSRFWFARSAASERADGGCPWPTGTS